MFRRKLLTGFLIVALSIGSAIPVFADVDSKMMPVQYAQEQSMAKISKDKATEIGSNKIKDTFGFDVQSEKLDLNIDFWPSDYKENGYYWYVSWNKYDDTSSMGYSVTIDSESGKVLGFNKSEYIYSENQPQKSVISKAKAKEIAEEYVKKVNSKEFSNFKYVEDIVYGDYQPVNYNFRYVRVVNGVEFDRDSIYLEVDGIKGNVVSYGYNYGEDVTFPSIEGVISKESAIEVFKKNIDMKLNYLSVYSEKDYNKIDDIKLVYNPEYKNGSMVDAKEGKMISWGVVETYNAENAKTKNISDAKKEDIIKSAKPALELAKELNKDEAINLMKANVKDFYNKDVNIEIIEDNQPADMNNKKVWNGEFGNKQADGSMTDGGGVSVDAATGEIVSIYKYDDNYVPDENFTPKLTWDQGYDKAIEVLAKYFPDKIKDIKTELPYAEMSYTFDGKTIPIRYINFYFPRTSNGLEYYANNVSVTFDMKTGEMIGLDCFWDNNIKLPNAEAKISKDQASKTFFEAYLPKLIYTITNTSSDPNKPKYEIKLSYILDQKDISYPVYNIDAVTGKAVDYNGKEVKK